MNHSIYIYFTRVVLIISIKISILYIEVLSLFNCQDAIPFNVQANNNYAKHLYLSQNLNLIGLKKYYQKKYTYLNLIQLGLYQKYIPALVCVSYFESFNTIIARTIIKKIFLQSQQYIIQINAFFINISSNKSIFIIS
ncbi:hypothetical protein pb186bvf_004449 [Paramecium bursaria]